jgi:5'-nucleotidase
MKMQLTGQQVYDLLNQQWAIEDHPRILHVAGLSYSWDATRPTGDRVVDVQRNGKSLDRKQRFTIVVNEYLAEGGDGFSVLAALPRQPTPLQDIDALERYVKKHSPIAVDPAKRIQRLP